MIGVAVALHLDALGLVDYRPDEVGGDCFVDHMPQTPDGAVAIFHTGSGGEADFALPYDEPTVQVMVRGSGDPRVSHGRAADIYGALHGLGHTTLPDGSLLISCIALQSAPIAIGQDETGRHRHTLNFALDTFAPTTHRPAHV